MSAIPSCTSERILALPGVGLPLPQPPSASVAWTFELLVYVSFTGCLLSEIMWPRKRLSQLFYPGLFGY